ncbi:uncharacterized protein TNCV_91041 [Trichonephila clavipes]|nr:uncharacterized protein TNCV_91041 [Trichonephila clavipes]
MEDLGIRDDPVLHERDQAIAIFKETVEFEKGRYIVQLPFRKSYNELSDNYSLAIQHFQNLWRRFGHDSELYQQYREIIRDYTEQGIIEEVKTEITDNKLKRPVYYLPHQAQWKKENFNLHPVHETVSLGANGTNVLGLSWNTNEDYLPTDTKSLLEFVSLDKNTKRFILQAVGKISDPLGLISPFTVRMKCLLQDLWKEEIQWDDPLPTHIEKEWKKWYSTTTLGISPKRLGPLTVAEFKESEIKLIKHAQRSLFDNKEIPSSISNLFPFVYGGRNSSRRWKIRKCFYAISP